MRFKTIRNLSKYLGNVGQQDIIFHSERRGVYDFKNFTAYEKRDADERAKGIEQILVMSKSRHIDDLLNLLRVYMPFSTLGFGLQNEIVETLSHNGIKIRMEARR